MPAYRSALAEFAHPGQLSEPVAVRDRLRGWRFYDGFRVDADAPARRVGGRDRRVVRPAGASARCVAPDALGELSDGTLRFLLWAAALLSPEPPSLMVLNEPETSLHPDLVQPLATLIRAAGAVTQVLVITDSNALLGDLREDARDWNWSKTMVRHESPGRAYSTLRRGTGVPDDRLETHTFTRAPKTKPQRVNFRKPIPALIEVVVVHLDEHHLLPVEWNLDDSLTHALSPPRTAPTTKAALRDRRCGCPRPSFPDETTRTTVPAALSANDDRSGEDRATGVDRTHCRQRLTAGGTLTADARSVHANPRFWCSRLTCRFAVTRPAKMPGEGRLIATPISERAPRQRCCTPCESPRHLSRSRKAMTSSGRIYVAGASPSSEDVTMPAGPA
jgi:hypothetical protein